MQGKCNFSRTAFSPRRQKCDHHAYRSRIFENRQSRDACAYDATLRMMRVTVLWRTAVMAIVAMGAYNSQGERTGRVGVSSDRRRHAKKAETL